MNNVEMRKRPRKKGYFMPVDYVYARKHFCGSIMDISESGIRVLNRAPLDMGADTTMTFLDNFRLGPVKMSGRVVRSWDDGFAVNFTEPDPQKEFIISSFIASA